MTSPTRMAVLTAAMMVAMMLPSIAPVFWRYHRHVRTLGASAVRHTALLAAGYSTVWTVVSVALFGTSAALSPMGMPSMGPVFAPLTLGCVVACVGLVQCSRWKQRRLFRCRECVETHSGGTTLSAAWQSGCRLGIDCCLSCAAPMAVLFVAGLMDTRMMFVITAAITGERVAPGGHIVARFTGALALIAGIAICIRAITATAFGAA